MIIVTMSASKNKPTVILTSKFDPKEKHKSVVNPVDWVTLIVTAIAVTVVHVTM